MIQDLTERVQRIETTASEAEDRARSRLRWLRIAAAQGTITGALLLALLLLRPMREHPNALGLVGTAWIAFFVPIVWANLRSDHRRHPVAYGSALTMLMAALLNFFALLGGAESFAHGAAQGESTQIQNVEGTDASSE